MEMIRKEVLDIIKKEGDYKEFTYRTIKCFIQRNHHTGCLNGYIHLPKCLPKIDIYSLIVHGGITYENIEDDGTLVIGFDTNHINDLSITLFDMMLKYNMNSHTTDVYRTMDFVINEIESLVDDLDKITHGYIQQCERDIKIDYILKK